MNYTPANQKTVIVPTIIDSSSAAMNRSVERVFDATDKGLMMRLFGTVDCKGEGTAHPVKSLGPFILAEYSPSVKKGMPPYGLHPHHGMSVVSLYFGESTWLAKDNFGGEYSHVPGSLYVVESNRGCVHEEYSASENGSLLQIWIQRPRKFFKMSPEFFSYHESDIPQVATDFGRIYVLVGEFKETNGKVIEAQVQMADQIHIYRCVADKAGRYTFIIPQTCESGWVFARAGRAAIDGESITDTIVGVFGPGEMLEVAVGAGSDIIIAAGKHVNEDWIMYLHANGAFLCESEERAESIRKDYDEYKTRFGRLK